MKSRLKVARHPSVVRTAFKFALIVGPILVVINHGDAILAGTMDTVAWLKCALTMLIPYTVSTLSSINAYLDCEDTYE
ncbi:MAG: nitrate/nitrite transporter NrtS [Mariprofundales bacterium]